MRTVVVVMGMAAAVAVAVALSSGGGGDGDDRRPGAPGAEPPGLLAIASPQDGTGSVLRRLDPDTLKPRGEAFELGEYHGSWASSPDGRTLALGTFARTGVRLVDRSSLRSIRDVPLPVAAEGLGWLGDERVAVLLQRDGAVAVDTRSGRMEWLWRGSYGLPCGSPPQAVARRAVLFVLVGGAGAVSLLHVARDGAVRRIELPGVRAPGSVHTCGGPAVALAPDGRRAAVLASHGPLAELDLDSLRVATHDSGPLRRALTQPRGCRPRGHECTGHASLAWLDDSTLAAGMTTFADRRGARPQPASAGAALVDARTWTASRVDADAGAVAPTGDGGLLTFGGESRGLRAVGPRGGARWHALRRTRVRTVTATTTRVYALDEAGRAAYVLEPASGRVLTRARRSLYRLQLLSGRDDAGDVKPRAPSP